MKCPYSDSFIPRCEFAIHPKRENIEYCRLCGEWRHLEDIGNEFPNVFLFLTAIAIVVMILTSLLNGAEEYQLRLRQMQDTSFISRK